uniref:HTH psq-type domain-containing protein n=1 Tax=Oryzias latipes TaxID=8090 RepID=A0A3P9IQX8_ORYLA
ITQIKTTTSDILLRKMLSIADKVKLLDMLREGKSCAAVGRHYRINESSVHSIKKEEKNMRMTAAISFKKDAKRVATLQQDYGEDGVCISSVD